MQKRRFVLKISGEILSPMISEGKAASLANTLIELSKHAELAVVLGAGNLYRGRDAGSSIFRGLADEVGMLATVMNAKVVSSYLKGMGRVFTAKPIAAEVLYQRSEVDMWLNGGGVAFLAYGTGLPYFSTDSAAAFYAIDLDADQILKATNVDGVYDKDPKKHAAANRFLQLTYQEAIEKDLKVMDQTAFVLLKEHPVPIRVFSFDLLDQILKDETLGTHIYGSKKEK
ncbi:MAG: UMP kinase [Chlamydiae bacterium]|nr:UMP kinase [Chlamydiota bacterium]